MLDIKMIRTDGEKVKERIRKREMNLDSIVDEILDIDKKRRELTGEVESKKAEQNADSKKIPQLKKAGEDTAPLMERMKALSAEIKEGDAKLAVQELERIVQRKADNGQVVESILRWTGSKRALVELIYALEANGDFNKGTATLKEIAGYFENVFSIDIGDLYHSYLEMRSRKINRTRYLETLQKSLLRRMDENDT